MAVPGSDERDYEFAQKNKLDIIYVTKEQEFISYADIKAAPTKYILTNSDEFTGLTFKEDKEKILDKLEKLGIGHKKVNYRMLDWSVSRQRYWGAPIPIIHCLSCGPVLVPEKDLPVILPEITDYQPTGDGRSALARASDWLKVDCPKCGGPAERETDTLDTYIDSSWYMYRYFDPHNQEKIFDSGVVKKWEPIDFYNGADHATAHLLYARFLARFFAKIGLVNNPEPFKQFLFNGKVTAHDGTMFSKSKGNGVDPLEIIANGYGADALRVYLMFAAPLDLWVKWDPKGVPGAYRFLNRLWNLTQEYSEAKEGDLTPEISLELKRVINPMIKKVTEDIDNNHYNTAISAIMTALNDLYKLKVSHLKKNRDWQESLEAVIACTAPFAPHISEELWQQLGHSQTVHTDSWPKWEDKYLLSDKIPVIVQINGKLRAKLEFKPGTSKDEAEKEALANDLVKKHIEDKEVIKVIFVPDKLINIVTS